MVAKSRWRTRSPAKPLSRSATVRRRVEDLLQQWHALLDRAGPDPARCKMMDQLFIRP